MWPYNIPEPFRKLSAGTLKSIALVTMLIDHAAIAVVDEDNSTLSKRVADAFIEPMFIPPDKISRADIDPADRRAFPRQRPDFRDISPKKTDIA